MTATQHPTPRHSAIPAKYNLPFFLAVIAAGLAVNFLKIQIFPNIDFIFGSIFGLLALQFFGRTRGTLAAAVIAGSTVIIWNHPYTMIIMTAEVAVVGWLMTQRKIGMVVADTLYWLIIGMPLTYLFFHIAMNIPLGGTMIIIHKHAINGIANAVIARCIFVAYVLWSRTELISFREIVYNLLALFVLCPALYLLSSGSRTDFVEADQNTRNGLLHDRNFSAHYLSSLIAQKENLLVHLAEMAAVRSPEQMQCSLEQAVKSDNFLLQIELQDRSERTTAAFPPVAASGKSSIGNNYSGRYSVHLKQTVPPVRSKVVISRFDTPTPIVAILAPVDSHGAYGGYVSGIIDLDPIREFFDNSEASHRHSYTLLDKNGVVIMSNRPDQTANTPFARGRGTVTKIDKDISRWVPESPPNTPYFERWRGAYYRAESEIATPGGWKLILDQPMAPFINTLYARFSKELAQLFIILLLSLFLAELLSRMPTASLEKLRLATHNLPRRLDTAATVVWPESSIKETSHLICNFREMGDALTARFKELQQFNESLEQQMNERIRQTTKLETDLRIVINTMPIAFCFVKKRELRFVNPAFLTIFGYEQDTVKGMKTSAFYADDVTYERTGKEAYPAILAGGIYSGEVEMKKKDGARIWCDILGQAVNPEKPDEGSIWMLQDITGRRQAEHELAANERFMRVVTDTIPGMVAYWTSDLRCVYSNNAYEEWFGKTQKQMQGIHIRDMMGEELFRKNEPFICAALRGEQQKFERTLTKADGSIGYTWAFYIPSFEAGMVVGFFVLVSDITELKETQLELAKRTEEAETANIAKSQFLATMSHEIRTPMNGVIGALELLLHSGLTQEQRDYADIAARSGNDLLRLLNDILDLSKIEADKVELESADFNLNMEISKAIKLLSLHAHEKEVQLTCSVDADVPAALRGDPGRLRQVITNLVGNAIKFTPEGSISLQVSTDAEDEHSATLRLLVHDTGIGIAADKREHIFKPFTQGDGSTTRRFGGTGLGLTICKRLVEMMGGSIGVDSVEGEGSTFWFTVVFEKQVTPSLPHVAELEEPSQPSALYGERGMGPLSAPPIRILLTEDDPNAQKILPRLLQSYGYQVDVAGNGREALQALESTDYALVLMDCMMPEMSGYEVTALIRDPSSAVRRHDIPVIALTGNAMKQDRERCLAAGMDDHLSKPLLLADLLAKLDIWLKG